MPKTEILKEIIEGYRKLIHDRYRYDDIKSKIDIPPFINEQVVHEIRDYFLTYVYPDYSTRQELNEAFESMDSYIKTPEKLLRLLMNSITLLFTHGRHLPKLLNTGLKALKSFRTASKFEAQLAEYAIKYEISPPFDQLKIDQLLQYISSEDIDDFIENIENLVFVFRDKDLVEEILEILDFLIKRMKKRSRLYSANEIKGIELGRTLLEKGEALFNRFNYEEQTLLIELIIKIERSFLDDESKEKE